MQHSCRNPQSEYSGQQVHPARWRGSPAARKTCWSRFSRAAARQAGTGQWRQRAVAAAAAAGETGSAAASAPADTLGHLLALKEWAPTVAALASGDTMVLLRKGGIKEPTFKPASRHFFLFPTSFHTDAQLLKPHAAEKYAAECRFDPKAQPELRFATQATVTGAWTTHDPAVLEVLDELHIWGPGFLENRLRWRPKQPITVMELRVWRLPEPLLVAPREDMWGCFSWVDLAANPAAVHAAATGATPGPSSQAVEQAAVAAAAAAAAAVAAAAGTPALDDAVFAARQALCRQQLGRLADLQELAI